MKIRQNLYIDRELSDALEALATGPGTNKSRLVNDAIASLTSRDLLAPGPTARASSASLSSRSM